MPQADTISTLPVSAQKDKIINMSGASRLNFMDSLQNQDIKWVALSMYLLYGTQAIWPAWKFHIYWIRHLGC